MDGQPGFVMLVTGAFRPSGCGVRDGCLGRSFDPSRACFSAALGARVGGSGGLACTSGVGVRNPLASRR